jgi:hypothetical protein
MRRDRFLSFLFSVCEAQADILTKDKTSGLVDIAAAGLVDAAEFQLRA